MLRRMRASLLVALLSACAAAAAPQAAAPLPDAVSPRRPTPLFNGKDLTGWTADVPARDTDPAAPPSFVVRNGLLVSLGEPRGHLVTDGSYRDYRLEVEYRFPGTGGNCGVLVHASRARALYRMFPQSIEVQLRSGDAGDFWCIQENIEVPDMETRRPRKPGEKWGGAEGDARRILNLTDGSEKPLGEWNTLVVEARGRSLEVWVNGELVNSGTNATTDRGRIALQAEGSEVEFRRVEIGPLPGPGASERVHGPALGNQNTFPAFFLVGADGRVAGLVINEQPLAALKALVEGLLAPAATPASTPGH
jgi:hypothetical protein